MLKTLSFDELAEPEVGTPAINKATIMFVVFILLGVGAGLYAQVVGHLAAFNNTREVAWGILISNYAYFAIISTGLCLLAVVSHIFGSNRLAPLANRMVFLSIIVIFGAFLIIGLELKNPHRMLLYNMLSPNITSNIWWMGTLYSMAVGFMLVEFYLILSKRYALAVTLGVLGALAEVAANTTLGAVFATIPARPLWYGSQLPIYFLASAVMTGAAAIIMFTTIAHRMRGEEMSAATREGLQGAGKVMLLTLVLIAVATVWKFVAPFVGGTEEGRMAALSLLKGPLSFNFWVFETVIGMALPFVLLLLTRMQNYKVLFYAAIMILVGAYFQRYDLVVAGQLVPVYAGWDSLPTYLAYKPSLVELLICLGGFGVVGAGFLLGERFFGKAFRYSGHH
ncbi:NrfD/PsrC family molybdoenzyme membrane anchor subunit [Desulfurivibrio sp. D14AmB]|uniref:NrfD/PsrC family molybdoenzyme membrane anchor subunit n=1 Tax=Desulfurivibrio sp. D14AmB TaxID=3374370 RepID=UPI00376F1CA8